MIPLNYHHPRRRVLDWWSWSAAAMVLGYVVVLMMSKG